MIKLTDTLSMSADDSQYMVGKPYTRTEKGESRMTLKDCKYFTSVSAALRYAVDYELRAGVVDGSITTMREYLAECERLYKNLEDVFAGAECKIIINPVSDHDKLLQHESIKDYLNEYVTQQQQMLSVFSEQLNQNTTV